MLRLAAFFCTAPVGVLCVLIAHRISAGAGVFPPPRAHIFLGALGFGAGAALNAGVLSGAAYALWLGAWLCTFFHALTDLYCGYVFDIPAAVSLVCAAVMRLFLYGAGGAKPFLFGVAAGWSPMACLVVLTCGGVGWGDANIMAGAGAFLGWKMALLSLDAGAIAGGVAAAALLIARKVRLKTSLPLGPFLAFGVLVVPPIVSLLGNPCALI